MTHPKEDDILYQLTPATEEDKHAFEMMVNPPRQPKPSPEPLPWKCRYCGSQGPFDANGCKCREAV
jgi:hypothetical protein